MVVPVDGYVVTHEVFHFFIVLGTETAYISSHPSHLLLDVIFQRAMTRSLRVSKQSQSSFDSKVGAFRVFTAD